MQWASNLLFEGLNDAQLAVIEAHVKSVEFKPGEVVMSEGDPGEFLLLISTGVAVVYKNEIKLAERYGDDLVGLMSLVDNRPRSATVMAGRAGLTGYTIDRTHWEQLMTGEHKGLMTVLLNNYLVNQQKAIRDTNLLSVQETRAKLEQEQLRVLSAGFFVQMVIGLIIFTFALGTLTRWFKEVDSTLTGFGVLLVYASWSYVFVRQSGLPLKEFGLTMGNFARALRYTIPTTLAFIGAMFLFKWVMTHLAPDMFGTEVMAGYESDNASIGVGLMILLYGIHATMQEFIARGCIQGGLHQFVTGKRAAVTSIFVATMMFSVFHLMMDFNFALLTIIPGVFWGYLFYRERNVWSVAISHIMIGVTAFFILGMGQ